MKNKQRIRESHKSPAKVSFWTHTLPWQFQDPEIANLWYFLDREIAKMGDRS